MAFFFALMLACPERPGGYARPELLVDTAWLAQHLTDPNIRIVDMRPRGYGEGHIPGAVLARQQLDPHPNAPPTFLPTPQEFEALMVAARHLEHHARHRLRRARRHLRGAPVVDPQLLRPRERRAAGRRLDEVDAPNSAPTNAAVPAPVARHVHGQAGHGQGRDRRSSQGGDQQARREAHRRAHAGRDRRQGPAQHQARRLHRVVGSGVLGRHARPGDEDVQAGRPRSPKLYRDKGVTARRRRAWSTARSACAPSTTCSRWR